ncbi:MAG: TonB-dependent receptor [Gammaproteobacteria bacterium]|nr:TonB-dependent receptor [Gammaproteobacteria bacterium]
MWSMRWSFSGRGLPSAFGGLAAMAAAAFSGLAVPAIALADEVDEIVVTVRQRAESAQDVPGTVAVLSAEAIEDAGIQRARDFIALTPGVSIVNAAEVADSQVNIRGINGARDAETNYALVIDGILMTNPAALNREYANLEQIAILKGPQGAIYGRNAAAGAIVITTKAPGDELGGSVKASVAEDSTYFLSGLISGPASDTVQWSLAADYRDSDGYYANKSVAGADPDFYPDNGCSDCVDYFEGWNVNGRLIFQPTDKLKIDTKLHVGEVDAGSITFNASFHLPGLTFFGAAFAEDVDDHPFGFYPNIKPFNSQEATEFSVKVDYDLGVADLTAWGLYSDIENAFGADGTSGAFGFFNSIERCTDSIAALSDPVLPGGFPMNPPQFTTAGGPAFPNSLLGPYTQTACDGTQYQERNQKDYSFEARLASKSDQALRWLAGVYYLNIDRQVGVNTGVDQGFGIIESLYTDDANNRTEQLLHDDFGTDVYAVFGQLAWDVTDAIELSAALRYDREERDVTNLVPTDATTALIDTCFDNADGDPTPGADPINPGLCATGSIASQDETWDQFQPKVAATWDFTDSLTAFASVGMGFKSGGFNNSGSAATIDGFINDVVVDNTPVCGDGDDACSRVNIADQFDEETAVSAEIGLKGNILDNAVTFELAAYRTEVDDMQFFEFIVGPFGLLRVVSNIDEVTINGIEGGLTWRATDWLDLYAGAAFVDSEIDANSARPDTVGNESPYTPEWTGNAGARLTIPMGSVDFIANFDVSLVGDTWFHVVQDQPRPTGFGAGDYSLAQRDGYTLVNARVGVEGENWSVIAFGTNIFDEDYIEEAIPAPEFGGSFIHAGTQRRYGVEANYRF